MLYAASHDTEKVSDQTWNHIADTQIKAFLGGFCFSLLSVFVSLSLCCPGCLFLIVLTLKWQFWRGSEASVVLSPLQNMLELMCTDSSMNGEGETLACPLWLAQRKPAASCLSTWESSHQTDRHLGQQTRPTPEILFLRNCPLFSPSQGKRLKICAILDVSGSSKQSIASGCLGGCWMWFCDVFPTLSSVRMLPWLSPLPPVWWRQWVMLLRHAYFRIQKNLKINELSYFSTLFEVLSA